MNGRYGRYGYNGNGGVWGGFNAATVFQTFVPIIVLLSGFYYLTNYRLSEVDLIVHDTFPKELKAEANARETARNEFLDKLGKLNDSLATLNTNVAVQGQVLGAIKDELQKRK